MNNQNLAVKMQELFVSLNKGHTKSVIADLSILLRKHSDNADLLHLAALSYKADKQILEANKYYQKSLAIRNDQPQVHNNLANSYKLLEQFSLAEKHYKLAISLDDKYLDAWKNLGLLHLHLERLNDAETAFSRVLSIKSKDVSSLTSLANVYKEKGEYITAINTYKQALAIEPNYINAIHNLGLTYKLSEQLDLALTCFRQAKTLAPHVAEIDYNEANTLFEQGNYPEAEELYWQSLNKDPNNIEVHQTLNELYWQTNRKSEFGRSFKLAIEHIPTSIPLRHAFAESLQASGNIEEAQHIVEQALKIDETPALLHISGKITASNGDIKGGIEVIEKSLQQRYSLDVALDLIELLIIEYQYEKALSFIKQAELVEPFNQLIIALKSLCWRLTSDERYKWLIDYQQYVQAFEIPVPNGYSSRSEFLAELEHTLLAMHKTTAAPLKQTLKNGTQTPGRLLYKPLQPIIDLKNSFELVVREYIASLPNDINHPLLSRKSQHLNFAGSWSVRLKPNGYHVNHIHPKGWLSSSFYITVPDFSMSSQQSVHAGGIKFGESSLGLDDREVISRIIVPKAGELVLFPSYVWHGTYPFNGKDSDFRLTAPCDITPM